MINIAPSVKTPEDPYAGFWHRFGAAVIDSLILLVPAAILFLLLPKEVVETVMPDGHIGKEYQTTDISEISIGIVCLLYKTILESSQHQATFGKRGLKLIVTDLTGERISFSKAAFRSWPIWLPWVAAFRFVQPIVSLFALISCIAVGFTLRKQGLHDQMAKCLVVRRGTKFENVDVSGDRKLASTADHSPDFLIACLAIMIFLIICALLSAL